MSVSLPWDRPEVAEWPSELPEHLSASSLSMFERCPEMFRRRYLLGQKEAPSASLVWGNAHGRTLGFNFAQKIDTHEDLPLAEIEGVFAALLDQQVEEAGGAGEIDWRDDKPGDVKDRGVALAGCYHRQVSPRVQPTAVEERFSLDLPGVPVPFIGYIDVSAEAYSIEGKTASQRSKVIPPQYQLQTLGYALARSRPVEVHISTRTKLPAVVTPLEEPGLELPFGDGTADRAARIVRARARQIASLYETFGPDEQWPDAIGTMAWHTAVCDLCGWGPTGTNECAWWAT